MRGHEYLALGVLFFAAGVTSGCRKQERSSDQAAAETKNPALPTKASPAMVREPGPVAVSRSFRFSERKLPGFTEPEKLDSPMSLTASDGTGLSIVEIETLGVVESPLAFTQVRMLFHNPRDRQIEGRFRITMPPGASISRFAMKLKDRWQEGEVVERQAARRAYEDFLHRRQDPALLEQQAGNEFTARVFPIPPRGNKELLVSYSQEITGSNEAYRIPLLGLPKLKRLKIRVLVDKREAGRAESSLGGTKRSHQVVEVDKRDWIPDRDFEVAAPGVPERLGLRHENLVVARLAPDVDSSVEEIASLFVLVDTSASRALGFARQLVLIRDLVDGLAAGAGAGVPLGLACFDQDTLLVHEGQAEGFGPKQLDAVRKRRALGASDLQGALAWLSLHLREFGGRYERVLIVTDGVATAGETEGDKLREAVRVLGPLGVKRLDALVFGGIRDEASLRSLVTAGLDRDGVVIEGKQGREEIAKRLTHATHSDIKVTVEGASWVWPTTLDGLQAGDEVFVYADLPPDKPFHLTLGEQSLDLTKRLHPAERPLLQRTWVKARIDRLLHQRDTLASGDKDMRTALKKQVVDLSVQHRVLSPFTALLVLETEQDYRRFNIDRRALADILTVGPDGIALMNRGSDSLPLQAVSARPSRNPSKSEDSKLSAVADPGDGSEAVASGGLLSILGAAGDTPMADALGADGEAFGGLGGLAVSEMGGRGKCAASSNGLLRRSEAEKVATTPRTRSRALQPVGRVSSPRPQVSGSLDTEVIRRVIRRHQAQIKNCYERELRSKHDLQGRVEVEFTIDANGRVTRATLKSTTLNNTKVERCILARIKTWRFPKPSSGQVQVTFPFVFRPGSSVRNRYGPVVIRTPKALPYTGKFQKVMSLLGKKKSQAAHDLAFGWREEDPGNVLALVALGEALEALGDDAAAARAYGSLIDLFPSRADIRRFAGERLEALPGIGALALAADTYEKAVEQRPDHPASHRLHAFALHKLKKNPEAFEALKAGLGRNYPSGRFAGVHRILKEDLGLLAAAWIRAEPKRADEIREKLKAAGGQPENQPSVRFVLNWETDANDVDFHIHDGTGGHASYQNTHLSSGGDLYADVTTGYGPECFTIRNKPHRRAYPYRLQAHYYSRGPMGYGMGKLQIIEHDGEGGLEFDERAFVVMKDGAYLDLGKVRGRLK